MFSAALLDHFKNPRNTGELDSPSASAEVSNPVCGDVLRLSMRVENGQIVAARFQAQGCVAAIAASSLLTDLLLQKTLAQAAAITPEQISAALDGLPPASFHAAQLCCDALRALLKNISEL
ncbi:MAG: iron-sulfur cluster assembly scaffold protein [Candidatus Acidiferrales bacterium]